jgi:hypothetical protein
VLWSTNDVQQFSQPGIWAVQGVAFMLAKKSSGFAKQFPGGFAYTGRRPVDNQQE